MPIHARQTTPEPAQALQGTVPDPELAAVRSRAEAQRRPDALARPGRHCWMACIATDHAGRTGPLLEPGNRAGADPAARFPLRPAPTRTVAHARASASR